MQDQPGHKQELTQLESSSAVDGGFAAPGETDLCFRPHLDGRTTGETGVLCSESLKHVLLTSLS